MCLCLQLLQRDPAQRSGLEDIWSACSSIERPANGIYAAVEDRKEAPGSPSGAPSPVHTPAAETPKAKGGGAPQTAGMDETVRTLLPSQRMMDGKRKPTEAASSTVSDSFALLRDVVV